MFAVKIWLIPLQPTGATENVAQPYVSCAVLDHLGSTAGAGLEE